MFCSKCGNQVSDDAAFCGVCGNKLSNNQEQMEPEKSTDNLVSHSDSEENTEATPDTKQNIAADNKGFSKKAIAVASAVLAIAVVFFVLISAKIICFHQWNDATCIEPQKCSSCEKTQGEPLGHNWEPASCTVPETCKTCGEIEGEALGHEFSAATWTSGPVCKACGEIEGDDLETRFDKGIEAFSEGYLETAKEHFVAVGDLSEEAVEYLALIEKAAEFNGVYVEDSEDPHEWLVIENGDVALYHNLLKGGYTETLDGLYVPQEVDGTFLLVERYDYSLRDQADWSSFITLSETDGVKTIYLEDNIFDDGTYTLTDKSIESITGSVRDESAKKKPAIGMTAEEVRSSTWGSPVEINKTETKSGTREQWVYSTKSGRYIYLENGIVTAIQE